MFIAAFNRSVRSSNIESFRRRQRGGRGTAGWGKNCRRTGKSANESKNEKMFTWHRELTSGEPITIGSSASIWSQTMYRGIKRPSSGVRMIRAKSSIHRRKPGAKFRCPRSISPGASLTISIFITPTSAETSCAFEKSLSLIYGTVTWLASHKAMLR